MLLFCMSDVVKDMERANRLNEVYRHLFAYFSVKSQTEFAQAIKVQRTAMSAAMNGSKAYLTNNFFTKICAAFPGVFNLDYLLNGKGTLLTQEEDAKVETIRMDREQPTAFDTSLLIEKAVEKATAYADRLIVSLEKQVADKDDQLKEKDEMIAMLRRRIAELEAAQVIYDQRDPSKDYPFTTGVADKQDNVTTRV